MNDKYKKRDYDNHIFVARTGGDRIGVSTPVWNTLGKDRRRSNPISLRNKKNENLNCSLLNIRCSMIATTFNCIVFIARLYPIILTAFLVFIFSVILFSFFTLFIAEP